MTENELMSFRCADILTCNPNTLADLKQVRIPAELPPQDRVTSYLTQIQNPYLFRVNKLTVKVSFYGDQELSAALVKLMGS